MAKGTVFLEMSMSLDGFVAGPNVGVERPMGDHGGARVHDWMFAGKTDQQAEAFEVKTFADIGAVVMGRRTFDVGVGPWGDNSTFHAPCFVVSHDAHEPVVKEGGTTYSFVTDGIEGALEQAKGAAGDQDVMVMGGANIAQQFLKARVLDEIRLHLVPLLVGDGTRLFDDVGPNPIELEATEVIDDPGVTHFRFRVVN